MNSRFRPFLRLSTASVLTLLTAAFLIPATAVEKVESFELSDQFQDAHNIEFPLDRPALVTVAGRTGSKYIAKWVAPIYEAYEEDVKMIGIADLQTVPGFLKLPLRKTFQAQSPNLPILIDWEGDVVAAFDHTGTGIDIYVVDRDGTVLATAEGKPEDDNLSLIIEALKPLIKSE